MHGRSVSTVTAYTAHREWARRPPDERYASVHALAEAARARRIRTDARITETVDLQVQAVTADALAIGDRWTVTSADPLEFRAARRPRRRAARISPNAARTDRGRRDQLRAATCRPRTASALRGSGRTVDGPRDGLTEHARVHHDELADRVLDLMAQHPAGTSRSVTRTA